MNERSSPKFPKIGLKDLQSENKSMYSAAQIIQFIKEGKYKAGDKLPSERDLARQLGVSRHPVREALSALRLAGIITSRPGDGTFVASPGLNVEERVQEILKKGGSPLEAWEARKVMEGKVAEVAAIQATNEDVIKRSKKPCDKWRLPWRKGISRHSLEGDRDFHIAIAEGHKELFHSEGPGTLDREDYPRALVGDKRRGPRRRESLHYVPGAPPTDIPGYQGKGSTKGL